MQSLIGFKRHKAKIFKDNIFLQGLINGSIYSPDVLGDKSIFYISVVNVFEDLFSTRKLSQLNLFYVTCDLT